MTALRRAAAALALALALFVGFLPPVRAALPSAANPHVVSPSDLDTAGRLTKITRPDGKTLSFAPDADGNIGQVTWSDGVALSYTYDAANRPTKVTETSGGKVLAAIGWDPISRPTGLTFANGATAAYGYFPAMPDLNTLTHTFSGSSVTYTYGTPTPAHKVSSVDVSDPTYLWHPAAAGTQSYAVSGETYSTVGGKTYTTDTLDDQTADGINTYGYDGFANLTAVTPAGQSSPTTTYAYDPANVRISKTVGGVTTTYLGDAQRDWVEYDGSGNLLRRNVYVPGFAAPLAIVSGTAASPVHSYVHLDGLGSVVALSNDTGAVAAKFGYGPYGESASVTGTSFGYAGMRLDAETGFYYARARMYTPSLGRFLQRDPIGQTGGVNVFAYVGNDPLNRTDPTGLSPDEVVNDSETLLGQSSEGGVSNGGNPPVAAAAATNTGELSPLQAQIDLALPPNRGLPDALLRIDLNGLRGAGYDVPEFSQAGRMFNMPGGGAEMQFPYAIPPEFISVVK